MKKRLLILSLFLLLILTAAGASGKRESAQAVVVQGKITYLEGRVTVNGTDADFGTTVRSGDIVQTGSASLCAIVFAEKNVFQLRENTIVELDLSGASIKLRQGTFAAVFDKLSAVVADPSAGFSVESPQVVGGVRGTAFFFKVENEKSTYVCTCYGKVRYRGPAGKRWKLVEAYHHKAYRFIIEEGKTRTETAGLLYHDDNSMEALASRIGEKIRWGNAEAYSR